MRHRQLKRTFLGHTAGHLCCGVDGLYAIFQSSEGCGEACWVAGYDGGLASVETEVVHLW